MIDSTQLQKLTVEIHAGNVAAGWWSDLKTGASILTTRNRPEVMMLVITECMEAWQGASKNEYDDHLPHRPMFQVELADKVIREFDLLGAERAEDRFTISMIGNVLGYIEAFELLKGDPTNSHPTWLLNNMSFVSKAMEHYRKNRRDLYLDELVASVIFTFAMAELLHIPLLEIIAEKRAYNDTRADHKRENRLADGGKVI